MLPAPRLYPRGFLLTPSARRLPSGVANPFSWELPGFALHCEELTKAEVSVQGDTWVAIVGEAWALTSGSTLPGSLSIPQTLLKAVLQGGDWQLAVERLLYDVGGRYAVLIVKNGQLTVYNDACGTRSVFYSRKSSEVASHFKLILDGLEDRSLEELPGKDALGDLSWDRTQSPFVRSLLPNHKISVGAGGQVRFFPLEENPALALSGEERVELVYRLWREQLDYMSSAGKPIAFSMTAGLDSRMLLALARGHSDKYSSFTYTSTEAVKGKASTTRWSELGSIDYYGVEQMSMFLPEGHQYIAVPGERPSDPMMAWVEDNRAVLKANSTHSHNRRLLPRYMELFSNPQTVHYRGNLLEIGRLAQRGVEGSRREGFDRMLTRLIRGAGLPVDGALRRAHRESERLGYESISDDYDLTDIFFWEQRHGRWFSQVLNETDVVFDTLTPFNVRRIIDCFLAFSPGDRKAAVMQKELIYRAFPVLTFFGVNGDLDLFRSSFSPPQA